MVLVEHHCKPSKKLMYSYGGAVNAVNAAGLVGNSVLSSCPVHGLLVTIPSLAWSFSNSFIDKELGVKFMVFKVIVDTKTNGFIQFRLPYSQCSSFNTPTTMPVTFILLLGFMCGLAGKICVDTLDGNGSKG